MVVGGVCEDGYPGGADLEWVAESGAVADVQFRVSGWDDVGADCFVAVGEGEERGCGDLVGQGSEVGVGGLAQVGVHAAGEFDESEPEAESAVRFLGDKSVRA